MFETILVSDDGGAGGRDAMGLARALADAGARIVATDATSATALGSATEAEHADLVVLGPGDHAGRLLHGAAVPVAVAPERYANDPADRLRVIGVGFDGQPESQAALHLAEELALERRATMRVYAITEPADWSSSRIPLTGDEYRAALRATLGEKLREEVETLDSGVRAAATVVKGDPVGLMTDASREGLDLLVVGSHGRGPLSRVLLGSVSRELLERAECPVLVLPRAAQPEG